MEANETSGCQVAVIAPMGFIQLQPNLDDIACIQHHMKDI